jgi:hypothetical protein
MLLRAQDYDDSSTDVLAILIEMDGKSECFIVPFFNARLREFMSGTCL